QVAQATIVPATAAPSASAIMNSTNKKNGARFCDINFATSAKASRAEHRRQYITGTMKFDTSPQMTRTASQISPKISRTMTNATPDAAVTVLSPENDPSGRTTAATV